MSQHRILIKLLVLTLAFFAYTTHANQPETWVDIPPDPLEQIMFEYDQRFDDLDAKVQLYHKVPKTNWTTLPDRIYLLDEIIQVSKNISETVKREYLKRIAAEQATELNENLHPAAFRQRAVYP